MGFSARVFEAANDVGGTWYWNRYPGARCDVQSIDYSYSFDDELQSEWQWSEKYATQPEILRYLNHVADRLDLRRDITFSTRVDSATWDEDSDFWRLRTSAGNEVSCRFYVMATGCLSLPKTPDIPGIGRFAGPLYSTSQWPHEEVDFTGMRVAVIGTGSSGIQSIPLIAQQAAELTVFQRTPNFSFPAHNGPVPDDKLADFARDHHEYREAAKVSGGGVTKELVEVGAMQVSADERQARYEEVWAAGDLFQITGAFNDILSNLESNATFADFVRAKIRATVDDPQTAELLCPTSYPVGTKRPCLDSNYFETFNLDHVRLRDLRADPIVSVTETGIETTSESYEFDAIVLATGFDAMTGALVAVNIEGRNGLTLKQKWAAGPQTYLGLTAVGFPNFFAITGPGSPSVLSNMVVSIEQHVDWICAVLEHMQYEDLQVIEPTETAEAGWVEHVNDFADLTLFSKANSWYMGANVPGKTRVFLPYIGGVGRYRETCDEVANRDYLGFTFSGVDKSRCNDGVVCRLKPDVALMLEFMKLLELPELQTLSPVEARAFVEQMSAARPPGPDIGEIEDGVLLGAAGDLNYRLYRPESPGPHPIVVYFHGGGWVFGGPDSDDPLCRDLCDRSGAIILSVGYRHAPEDPFPAPVNDGFAAVKWVAENAEALGAIPGQLAVGGWSAGGNIAAVVCHMARDAGGPHIAGQVLLNPATDCDFTRPSYTENAEGFALTRAVMEWFWDHHANKSEREDPRASPLRATDLARLPPALVITSEFDPLRDEGDAYARALRSAGVDVQHLACPGQIHTSIQAVDVIPSGEAARVQMADAIRRFFGRLDP